jgi:hypothetical protein
MSHVGYEGPGRLRSSQPDFLCVWNINDPSRPTRMIASASKFGVFLHIPSSLQNLAMVWEVLGDPSQTFGSFWGMKDRLMKFTIHLCLEDIKDDAA